MLTEKLFARYVKDALANYYDPIHLQTHPLTTLVPSATKGPGNQALRQTLREAIEALQPDPAIPFGRPEWLSYRVLWMRHMDGMSQAEVCEDLGLSRASFYRSYREAFEAVVNLLWQGYVQEQGSQTNEAPQDELSKLLQEEVVRVAHAARTRLVQLTDVLGRVLHTLLPLLEQQGVHLVTDIPAALPATYGNPALLHQMMLNTLAEALPFVNGHTLRLTVHLHNAEMHWQVQGLRRDPALEQALAHAEGLLLSRSLLDVYGGRMWFEQDAQGCSVLSLALPIARSKTILIIDDDADTVSLYQRYLQDQDFVLQVANGSEEFRALLAEGLPDLILLDVLMPDEDGWDILQRLKTMPETAHIPVVICSVLSQPRLAFVLGAAEVLQKPIDHALLLRTVHSLLDLVDSAPRGSAAVPEGSVSPA